MTPPRLALFGALLASVAQASPEITWSVMHPTAIDTNYMARVAAKAVEYGGVILLSASGGSHVREGKDAADATPADVFAGCAEKDIALALEFGRGESLGVQLDLTEGDGAVDLVFGDEVDFAVVLRIGTVVVATVVPVRWKV